MIQLLTPADQSQGGRLLICSMHQPRHELMRLFDARQGNLLFQVVSSGVV